MNSAIATDSLYPLPTRGEEGNAKRPYSNTGERSTVHERQRVGEAQISTEKAQIAFIDFLTIVFPARDIFRFDKYLDLEDFAQAIDHYFLSNINLSYNADTKGGRNGYKHHWKIEYKAKDKLPIEVGFFCFGGNNDTICITLTGSACKTIGQEGFAFIRDFIEELKGHITRIDLAHDCLYGEVNLSQVREWYDAGTFRSSSRGKYPNCQFIDDCGSGKGCTLYVGSRESGKYFRAYEKGKQLGDSSSDWVRLELELHNKKRGIPYEILDKISEYLSGAYQCLEYLHSEQSRILTEQKSEQITFEHLEHYCKQAYGRFVEVMLQVYDGCPDVVVEQLRRDDALPQRLIPASIPIRE